MMMMVVMVRTCMVVNGVDDGDRVEHSGQRIENKQKGHFSRKL